MRVGGWLKHEIHCQILSSSLGEKKMPDTGKITGNKPILAWIMWDLLAYLKHTILNATESDKRHFCFHHGHFVILKSFLPFEMAQFTENIGVLIEYNRNPITLQSQCEMHKLQMGAAHGTCDRPVNEGLWLAFVKTQWSPYILKVRLLFWHEEMKTFYFLGECHDLN